MGILSTFLFIGRSSVGLVNYSDMELEARKGLEIFAVDTRQASELYWVNASTVRLTINGLNVTYSYDSQNRNFVRTDASGRQVLLTNVRDFEFRGYQINSNTPIDLSDLNSETKRVAASNVTKQIQISLRSVRSAVMVVDATNRVFSARYILRNKRVTV